MKHYFYRYRLDWKLAFGSFLSWELAQWAGSKHPYLAPITIILCLRSTVDKSIKFTFQRIIGTIIGVFITALLATLFGVHGWSIGLLIIIGAMASRLVGMNEIVVRQMAISVLLVLVFIMKGQSYAIDRFRDTLIGAVVAIALNLFLFPPSFLKEVKQQSNDFFSTLTNQFEALSNWISDGCLAQEGKRLKQQEKELLNQLHHTSKVFKKSKDSLLVTPFSQKKRIELVSLQEQFNMVKKIHEHYRFLLNTMLSWEANGYLSKEDQTLWARQMGQLTEKIKQVKKNLSQEGMAAFRSVSVQFQLPHHIESHRYSYALYHDSLQLVEDLKKQSDG